MATATIKFCLPQPVCHIKRITARRNNAGSQQRKLDGGHHRGQAGDLRERIHPLRCPDRDGHRRHRRDAPCAALTVAMDGDEFDQVRGRRPGSAGADPGQPLRPDSVRLQPQQDHLRAAFSGIPAERAPARRQDGLRDGDGGGRVRLRRQCGGVRAGRLHPEALPRKKAARPAGTVVRPPQLPAARARGDGRRELPAGGRRMRPTDDAGVERALVAGRAQAEGGSAARPE